MVVFSLKVIFKLKAVVLSVISICLVLTLIELFNEVCLILKISFVFSLY